MARAFHGSQSGSKQTPQVQPSYPFCFASSVRDASMRERPVTIFDRELREMARMLERLKPRSSSAALKILHSGFPDSALATRAQACEAYARRLG